MEEDEFYEMDLEDESFDEENEGEDFVNFLCLIQEVYFEVCKSNNIVFLFKFFKQCVVKDIELNYYGFGDFGL